MMSKEFKEMAVTIRERKRIAEQDIALCIGKALREFTEATTLTVSGVSVELVDVTELGDSSRKYTVGPVSIEVKL